MDKGFNSKQKDELSGHLQPILKDLRKIKSDLRTVINHFDRRLINHDFRIEKLEKRLGVFQD